MDINEYIFDLEPVITSEKEVWDSFIDILTAKRSNWLLYDDPKRLECQAKAKAGLLKLMDTINTEIELTDIPNTKVISEARWLKTI